MTTQTLDTQIFLNDTEYAEVYDADGDLRLYVRANGDRPGTHIAVDVPLTPRQARQLARLLLQAADEAEDGE